MVPNKVHQLLFWELLALGINLNNLILAQEAVHDISRQFLRGKGSKIEEKVLRYFMDGPKSKSLQSHISG